MISSITFTRDEIVTIALAVEEFRTDQAPPTKVNKEIPDALNEMLRSLGGDEFCLAESPEIEPGRWWKVIAPDGSLWCETSDEDEARASMRDGDKLLRLYVGRTDDFLEWRDEQ